MALSSNRERFNSPCCVRVRPTLQLPSSLQYLCLDHMLPAGFAVPLGCQISMTGRACCQENIMEQCVSA